MARLLRGRRRAAALALVLFVGLGFVASSTYLTNNDARFLSGAVPADPTHITASALASQAFLVRVNVSTTVYMDEGSLNYFGNSNRAPEALTGLKADPLSQLLSPNNGTYVLINRHFIPYGDPSRGTLYDVDGINSLLSQSQANLVFDAGTVQVFFFP